MNEIVLDAGAFIAYERGRSDVVTVLLAAQRNAVELRTSAGVLAQIWRGGTGPQTQIARLVRGVDVVAIDEHLARGAGTLLARAGTTDPIDATVVLVAGTGDVILTSDPAAIDHLARAAGADVRVQAC